MVGGWIRRERVLGYFAQEGWTLCPNTEFLLEHGGRETQIGLMVVNPALGEAPRSVMPTRWLMPGGCARSTTLPPDKPLQRTGFYLGKQSLSHVEFHHHRFVLCFGC